MKVFPLLVSAIFIIFGVYACAEGIVTADTGNCNIRISHDLDAEAVGILYLGDSAPYAGKVFTDDRGVDWYSIDWDGDTCWVSSRYTQLEIDGTLYQNETTIEAVSACGTYIGEEGYTAVISDDPQTITVIDPEGRTIISASYDLKNDGEGFLSANALDAFFYPRTCLGNEVILYYSGEEFQDMLILLA